MQYIVYAIPAFFILIGVELLIDRLKKTGYYRLNDAVTNISLGIGSQLAGLFIKGLTLGVYIYIYKNHRIIQDIPQNALTVFLLFIGIDFFYYWFHRLAHEIGVLWGSHVVHHQSEEYNFSVALRQSWSQGMFSWVFYLPLAFIGFSVELFVLINALQTLYQFWIHTKLIHKMPAPFEYVFNTPSHHRVHHGQNPLYIDRNHGGTLIIFDRLFGTFQEELEPVVYGITQPANSWNPLWLNIEYWIDWYHNFINADGIINKLKTIYKYPGWKANQSDIKAFNPAEIKKFDVFVSKKMNTYVLIHFVIILLLSSVLLNILGSENMPLLLYQKSIIASFLIYSLFSIGIILENKKWSLFVELIRLLLFQVVLFYISQISTQVPFYMTYVFGAVSLFSMLFLILNRKKE
jgi:sterol desaturase/sphingolipid hydroxylase (fatty acid hydroxylase superfamily)